MSRRDKSYSKRLKKLISSWKNPLRFLKEILIDIMELLSF
jgi:hypothetical protein